MGASPAALFGGLMEVISDRQRDTIAWVFLKIGGYLVVEIGYGLSSRVSNVIVETSTFVRK
jgi:hypothetical protein